MGDIAVRGTQPGQQLEKDLKKSGEEALSNVRTIRNVAAGVAVAGVAAMAAEAAGVVTIPAIIPTAGITLAAGGVAVAFGIIDMVATGANNLIESAQKKAQEQ